MANYTYRTEVLRRRVYELRLPTDRDELYKVLTASTNDWHRVNPDKSISATDLLIESDGEILTISFEIETKTEPEP
jgi:hypothetical protein